MKIIRRIKNLIRWFPVIFKDEDWDSEYLLEIILFKLKNMEDFFRYKGMCVGAEDRADIMKELITIGSRLLEDNYEWRIVELYDILSNRTDLVFAKEIATGDIITKREYFAKKEECEKLREKDLNDFFTIFRNNINDLWD